MYGLERVKILTEILRVVTEMKQRLTSATSSLVVHLIHFVQRGGQCEQGVKNFEFVMSCYELLHSVSSSLSHIKVSVRLLL
jgi:hypothetical protein